MQKLKNTVYNIQIKFIIFTDNHTLFTKIFNTFQSTTNNLVNFFIQDFAAAEGV